VQPLLQWKSNEYYILWACVCNLRHAACNAHAPCLLWPARLYNTFIYIISQTARFSKKKVIDNKTCFDFVRNVRMKHFSLSEEMSKTWSKMYIDIQVKYPLFLPDFNGTSYLLDRFFEKSSNTNFIKSVQWEPSCSMRTDRQTRRSFAFRNFANAPNDQKDHYCAHNRPRVGSALTTGKEWALRSQQAKSGLCPTLNYFSQSLTLFQL
jgi:hypothetical protein